MKNPLKTYTMIFLGLGIFCGSPILWASSEEILNQELQRRQVLAKPLDEALKNSNILAQQGNLLEAYNTLEKAYSAVSESIRQTSLGASVRFKLSELGARLAESASK